MVVDYAIGLAILGLFPAALTPVLLITVLLLAKMVWDIARRWDLSVPLNPVPILGLVLSVVGACTLALLAWLSGMLLGAVLPLGESWALSAALLTGSWTLGASVNQFFMNGFLRRRSGSEGSERHA